MRSARVGSQRGAPKDKVEKRKKGVDKKGGVKHKKAGDTKKKVKVISSEDEASEDDISMSSSLSS